MKRKLEQFHSILLCVMGILCTSTGIYLLTSLMGKEVDDFLLASFYFFITCSVSYCGIFAIAQSFEDKEY